MRHDNSVSSVARKAFSSRTTLDTSHDSELSSYLNSHGFAAINIDRQHVSTNRLARVTTKDHGILWVKQGWKNRSPEGDLLAEGLAYLAANLTNKNHFIPRCIIHDRMQDIIITKNIPGKTIRQESEEIFLKDELLARIGKRLAEIHIMVKDRVFVDQLSNHRTCPLPIIGPLSPNDFANQSMASLDLIRHLQGDSELLSRLKLLKQGWSPSSVIHGDFRSDNILLAEDGNIILIDWEHARLGDQLYDVGTYAADILESTVNTLWVEEETSIPAKKMALELQEATIPAIQTFWHTYSDHLKHSYDPPSSLMMIGFMGAALLHRVYSSAMLKTVLHKQDLILMSIARNLILNPIPASRKIGNS